MKNFKDILSEIAQPKSGDEKKFKDLHKIELIKHPVAPDSQFTGEIDGVERKPRPADQDGDKNYDPHLDKKDKPFKLPRDTGGGALRKENTEVSFKDLMNKITSEEDLLESPQEEIPMMMKQLHYICYACEDLMEFLATDEIDPEEWWQNKLAQVFGNVKSLHAYAKGSEKAAEAEKDIDLGGDDVEEQYESIDEEIAELLHEEKCSCCGNEITKDGCGCDEDCPHCGGKGKVEEAVQVKPIRAGQLVLGDRKRVSVKPQDAKLLDKMFKTLRDKKNKEEMYELLMSNERGYNEILDFAKKAGI